jgi:hypothetical protein
MSLKRLNSGATLIEVMLAVVITVSMVVMISLVFPKGQAVLTQSRQKYLATNLASNRIQQVKSTPYDYIQITTPTATTYFPISGVGANGCTCSKENLTPYPMDDSAAQDSIQYQLKMCVNLAEYDPITSTWKSHCPDGTSATDFGIKLVRVHVDWMFSGHPHSVDMESMVNR